MYKPTTALAFNLYLTMSESDRLISEKMVLDFVSAPSNEPMTGGEKDERRGSIVGMAIFMLFSTYITALSKMYTEDEVTGVMTDLSTLVLEGITDGLVSHYMDRARVEEIISSLNRN